VGDPSNGGYKEYYLRDAQGNIMAMYRYTNAAGEGPSLKVTDRPVYGSSRLGSYTRQMELVGEPTIINYPYTQPMQAPLKRYELTDHLGNVNTVVTGRLLPLLGLGVQYQAEVVSAQGYESFGSLLPGRNYNSGSSRYLFQGQEHDDEINGAVGTSYAFEYRMHDPRVGRFLSIDPLAAEYPHNSPYAFSENRVIDGFELEGLEHVNNKYWVSVNAQGKPAVELFASDDAADPGAKGWGVHMRFFDKQSGQEIKEMTAFAPTDAPWIWFKPYGNAYLFGTQVGARAGAFEGEDGFKNGGAQIMLGTAGLFLGGASLYAGGLTFGEAAIATAGMVTSADDITAGSGRGTLLENLVGKSNSDKLKLGVDLLSLSGGLRSLLTNSSVTKGNVIMENKDYDNFLLDLINVVNDEVNTLMGVEQQVTDD